MIPKTFDLKRDAFLILAGFFLVAAVILVLISMDDGPGPPPKPRIVPMGFKAEMLEDSASTSAQTYIKFCAQCHDLPNPKSHTAEEWPNVVARMVNRLRRMRFFSSRSLVVPGNETVNEIVAYLSRHALKGGDVSFTQDQSPAELLFQKKCSQCHALPDPTLHTPAEWITVVERMKEHIARMQKDPISDAEKTTLLNYLSGHAR